MAEPAPDGLAGRGPDEDPIGHPLVYPGRLPATSGLLDGDRYRTLRRDGAWRLDDGTALDDALRGAGRPALAGRHPVVAVGSNGSPAQLRRKFAGRAGLLLPMTYVTVRGLVPGVSAHVSRPGYVPAAPLLRPGATARLLVLWPDDAQLAVLDATEPNYRRVPVPAPVRLDGLTGGEVYAGRHGCLVDRHGMPFGPAGQAELLTGLLADLPALGRLTGARGPEEFTARLRADAELRERVRLLWRREGRAAPLGPQ